MRRSSSLFAGLSAALLSLPFALSVPAAPGPDPDRSVGWHSSVDWPQWRGPGRDAVSVERGLLPSWPEGGPKLAWTAGDLGRGYSSPVVADGSIYITGDADEELRIFALDLEGKPRWTATNGRYWRRPYPGSRSSCQVVGDRLYHMNAHGRIACLATADGKEVWSFDVLGTWDAKNIIWGRAESILVDGDRVIATVAGAGALMAALDRHSGKVAWTTPALEGEKAAYASPRIVEAGGRRLVVGCGSLHVFAVDVETGELAWKHRHPVPESVISVTPVVVGDSIYVANSSREHWGLYRLRIDGKEPAQVWNLPVATGHGAMLAADGRIWATNVRSRGSALSTIHPELGIVTKVGDDLVSGSSVWADGRLYHLGQKGEMSLLAPAPDGGKLVGRFRLVDAKRNDAWAHPVIAGGHLLLRYHETLSAYDVRAK